MVWMLSIWRQRLLRTHRQKSKPMKIWRQEEWANCLEDSESMKEMSVNRPEKADAADPDERKKAREKAVYYLQFSGKTECELRKKLAEQEFSPASVDSAIEFVKQHRYLDDEDYARRFVERNRNKKRRRQMNFELAQKEKQKISAYLARKGFSYDAISAALIQFARKAKD